MFLGNSAMYFCHCVCFALPYGSAIRTGAVMAGDLVTVGVSPMALTFAVEFLATKGDTVAAAQAAGLGVVSRGDGVAMLARAEIKAALQQAKAAQAEIDAAIATVVLRKIAEDETGATPTDRRGAATSLYRIASEVLAAVPAVSQAPPSELSGMSIPDKAQWLADLIAGSVSKKIHSGVAPGQGATIDVMLEPSD